MDLKITDSSITLDSETGLYWLDIGQESSGFESIYYNMDGVERIFGNQMRILLEGVDISYSFKDSIIGVSDFFGYSIIRWYTRNSHIWKTYFFKEGKLSSFQIRDSLYYIFLYQDIYGKSCYSTNFNDKNFFFSYSNKQLVLKNTLFDTTVYSHTYSWNIPAKQNIETLYIDIDRQIDTNIVDIFIFSDISGGNRHREYGMFLKSLHGKRLSVGEKSYIVLKIEEETEDFFPVLKVGIYLFQGVGEQINLTDIQNLVLSYLPEYCLVSVINNPEIEKWFNKIKKVSSLEIGSMDGLLETSTTIGEYNKEGKKSWDNFLQIQYNYYILKTNLRKIDELLSNLPESDPQYELLRQRNLINKSSIEAVLPKYEAFLNAFKSYKKEE